MSGQGNMFAAEELFQITAAWKASSKQSVQTNNSKNQNRICKKIVYIYGCQGLQ